MKATLSTLSRLDELSKCVTVRVSHDGQLCCAKLLPQCHVRTQQMRQVRRQNHVLRAVRADLSHLLLRHAWQRGDRARQVPPHRRVCADPSLLRGEAGSDRFDDNNRLMPEERVASLPGSDKAEIIEPPHDEFRNMG